MLPEEKQKLLDYIKTAIDVETDIETQNQIKAECTSVMEKKRPMFRTTTPPPCPAAPMIGQTPPDDYKMGIVLIIVCPIIALIAGLSGAVGAAILFVVFAICGLIIAVVSKRETDKAQMKMYETEMRKYEQILEWNTRNDREKKKQYDIDFAGWSKLRDEVTNTFVKTLNKTQEIRTKLYDKNLIYPKYQNLPALTSIYEYFITGRCEELTGPHGAYNMYEDEMRKDTVISQLNTVIANLEQIKQNQYMLYQQVKTIQKTASVIGNELAQIRGYTAALTELSAMNAYYNAVSARNSRIMTAYHLLS
ncbi:MAG: hypothetical protein Q4D43_10560 [Clostridia bacterium]|nr:hypothetical protein [Clostridia bacterium]